MRLLLHNPESNMSQVKLAWFCSKTGLVELRAVEVEDAASIVRIRNSGDGLRYLTPGAATVEEQQKWLQSYAERNKNNQEHYFVIRFGDATVGTIRIYNIEACDGKYEWGSWRIVDVKNPLVAVVSALIMYDFAFDYLRLTSASFVVAKDNMSVVAFHKNMGAKVVREESDQLYFLLTKSDSEIARARWKRSLLPEISHT